MAITKKRLMGGDKMARPGGVKTMQDEINEGLRDKSGRPFTEEELQANKNKSAEKAEEESTQAAPAEDQAQDSAESQADGEEKPQGSGDGGEQPADPSVLTQGGSELPPDPEKP